MENIVKVEVVFFVGHVSVGCDDLATFPTAAIRDNYRKGGYRASLN